MFGKFDHLEASPAFLRSDVPPCKAFNAFCYTFPMTLLEAKFELQSPLTRDQLRALGEFANTYGLRRFQLDDTKRHLSFEYDASRLRETQVTHVLGQAGIAVARRLN